MDYIFVNPFLFSVWWVTSTLGKRQVPPSITHRGERHGDKGYFIKPTIFTDVRPDMKIVKEEIFGPVAAIIKFKDEAEVYGLPAHIFTQNVNRSIRIVHGWDCMGLSSRFVLYFVLMTEPGYVIIGQLFTEFRAECSVWRIQTVGHRPRAGITCT